MEQKTKKIIVVILAIVILAVVGVVVFTSNSKEKKLSQAEVLDWATVSKEYSSNNARGIELYEGKTYTYIGQVSSISEKYCLIGNYGLSASSIDIYFKDKSDLAKLNIGDTIEVVGKLYFDKGFPKLKSAYLINVAES